MSNWPRPCRSAAVAARGRGGRGNRGRRGLAGFPLDMGRPGRPSDQLSLAVGQDATELLTSDRLTQVARMRRRHVRLVVPRSQQERQQTLVQHGRLRQPGQGKRYGRARSDPRDARTGDLR